MTATTTKNILGGTEAARDELSDILAFRGERFGAIAGAFFQEATAEEIASILEGACDSGLDPEDATPEGVLSRGLASLDGKDLVSFATKTRIEYARLFIGPREVVAPLHESAYLSGTKRMFTSETLDVRKFYADFGYVMVRKNREPEDSVGVEFEFLRNLCERAADAVRTGNDAEMERLLRAQGDFKQLHLNRWIREFAALVVEHDASRYYRAWALYLEAVLDDDDTLVERCFALLDTLRGGR